MALTPKQERFCREFVIDLNATQAAVRAGYSKKHANKNSKLLTDNPEIKARLAELQKGTFKKLEISAERVLQEFAKIAFADPRSVMEWGEHGISVKPSRELSDDDASAIAEVSETRTKDGGTMKVKMHDKVAALNALGRHLALFTDRISVTDLTNLSDAELLAASVAIEGSKA